MKNNIKLLTLVLSQFFIISLFWACQSEQGTPHSTSVSLPSVFSQPTTEPTPSPSISSGLSTPSPLQSSGLSKLVALSLLPASSHLQPAEVIYLYVIAKDQQDQYLDSQQLPLIWNIDHPELLEMLSPGFFRAIGKSGTVMVSVQDAVSGVRAQAQITLGQIASSGSGYSGSASGGHNTPSSFIGCLTGKCQLSVLAGLGTSGNSGDDGLAVNAELNEPRGLAVDRLGNVYIADTLNHQVRKIDSQTQMITRWTGIGIAGNLAHGIPALFASLNAPRGLTLDAQENLLITEQLNHRVQIVIADNEPFIFKFAGTGEAGPLNSEGSAEQRTLNLPSDVVVDSNGNTYIADTLNHAIRKVDPEWQMTTIAGTGTPGSSGDGGNASKAKLYLPDSVAISPQGDIFISDTQNHKIRKIDRRTNQITTYAGTGIPGFAGDGGQARNAQLNEPHGLAIDSQGNLYIADTFNHRIRLVRAQNQQISTLVGEGQLLNPYDLALDQSGYLYIADTLHHQIKKFAP